jgi:pSer/pThr/pTyr-binding forkhead associated (FHA) protein
LTDLQSKNGTFANGKLLTTHWLQPGDVVMIGKHTLGYKFLHGEVGPAESQTGVGNKTM